MKISLFSLFNIPYSAYSLRLLCNSLRKSGFPSKVYYYPSDFRKPYNRETLKKISKYLADSDIIGISLFTNHFSNAVLLTEYLKQIGSKALIVFGGVHSIVRPEECLKYADIVCVGEAEECFPLLCEKIASGKTFTDVAGFWHVDRKTKQIIKNPPHFVEDLNSIPFALYSEDHLLIEEDKLTPLVETNIPYYGTLASRGCPFGCTYCINNYYNKRNPKIVRFRTIDNLLQELFLAKKQHKEIKYIMIDDDAFFTMDLKYIKEFASRYKKQIDLPFYISGITPRTISQEKLAYLTEAGLKVVRMGFQSASQKILSIYKRHYTQEHMLKSVEISTGFDIATQLDIITDNPWESEEDTLETILLLNKAKKPFQLNIFNLVFFPGTDLYERAKKEGLISDEKLEIYNMRYHSYRKNALNTTLELLDMRSKIYLSLPFIIEFMLKNRKHNSKLYSYLIKFYKSLNRFY
ncbi:B12-binding domain-containing radical SAM protein, partial [Candidatus Omnitrophota bacterium]